MIRGRGLLLCVHGQPRDDRRSERNTRARQHEAFPIRMGGARNARKNALHALLHGGGPGHGHARGQLRFASETEQHLGVG